MNLLKRIIGLGILFAILCMLISAHFETTNIVEILVFSLLAIGFMALMILGMLLMLGEL